MRLRILSLLVLVSALLPAAPAAACIGQIVVSPAIVSPGGEIKIRGFGFWADPRPVTLAWENGPIIAVVQPDPGGNFELTSRAPAALGTFRVVATQGEFDPAPFYASLTVAAGAAQAAAPQPNPEPVVLPVPTRTIPWVALAILLGGIALAGIGRWVGRGATRTWQAY
ncbi:MAG: hypothetical protein C4315_11125 [Chloroflexota bacterium]